MNDKPNRPEPPSQGDDSTGRPVSRRIRGHLRGYFLAGVLITAPVGLTVYLAWLFINWVDEKITPLLPPAYNPETYLPFSIPGLGLLIVCLGLTAIGALTAGLVGRMWMRALENVLSRMPVIRSVYGAFKQIFETVLSRQSNAFREVVLFEYPRRGSWAMGFITGRTEGEIQDMTEDDVVNVFLPTTPNPTSGYLLFLPRREIVRLSMSVEEGIKMIVSGGIVTPPDHRPLSERGKVLIGTAFGDTRTIPPEPSPPEPSPPEPRTGSAEPDDSDR